MASIVAIVLLVAIAGAAPLAVWLVVARNRRELFAAAGPERGRVRVSF